jgi:hypothetical protein
MMRVLDFVVVMATTRGKQSFLPYSYALGSIASWQHGLMVALIQRDPPLRVPEVADGGRLYS